MSKNGDGGHVPEIGTQSVNDDQDLMISWLDVGGLRKREECGVTPMFLNSWVRGGVTHPEKGQF